MVLQNFLCFQCYGVKREPTADREREGIGKHYRDNILRQKGKRRAFHGGGNADAVHRGKLQNAAEVAEQQTNHAEQNAKHPAQNTMLEIEGKTAEEHHDQESVNEAAGGTDQLLESGAEVGEHGNADRAHENINANRAESQLPTDHETAKGNGKGLKRHGNAEKVEGNGDDGQNRDNGGEESGKGDLQGTRTGHGQVKSFLEY